MIELSEADRRTLVSIAREAVRAALAADGREVGGLDVPPVSTHLREPGASFVTLRRGDRLLGCIGTMEPIKPLHEDVAHNAWAAAFADPRLPSVTWDDFGTLSVKVSVLGPLEPLDVDNPAALAAEMRPGLDGLMIEAGRQRGTFLPSVWEQLPERDQFLDALWQKAGLRAGTWPSGLRVWRYRTDEFGD